jgi:hypothetical protein
MVWAIEKKLGIDVACAIEEPMVCQTPRWRKMDGFELSGIRKIRYRFETDFVAP